MLFLSVNLPVLIRFFFFFNDTATTEIYTLSLHDALPIYPWHGVAPWLRRRVPDLLAVIGHGPDRKSTRLNSSHTVISYAVFCLKKKKKKNNNDNLTHSKIEYHY